MANDERSTKLEIRIPISHFELRISDFFCHLSFEFRHSPCLSLSAFRPYNTAMPYRSLADFLEDLARAGELTRVEEEVDPALQVAQITARTAQSGGPALLFGAVKGHHLPVLTNLLATEGRICRVLGVASLDEVADRIAGLLDVAGPQGWLDRLKGGHQPAALSAVVPRVVKSAPCQQIVRLGSDIDLGELPLLQTRIVTRSVSEGWVESRVGQAQRGPTMPPSVSALTAATVLSAEPDSHRPMTGQFDIERLDRNRLAVCWAADDEHSRLAAEYRARDQKMPLAIVIGGDPAFLLAAAAPLPADSDVCAVAGLLREKPLDIVACRGVDLSVPAEAEIILEGFCDPTEPPVMSGPHCAPLGHSTPPRPAPVMHVTALTHRANPIFAAAVPGKPPHEAVTVARAMQRVFLPLVQLAMPELVDYDLPEFAAARHWAAVSIRKTYPGQGRRSAHAAWGLRPLRFAKMLIIVDDDVDVRNRDAVLAAVAANFRADRDLVTERGPADPFDPPHRAMGKMMALDATTKTTSE
jgi:4-hydroxy-3-polyprenylbenzoate decarboxylase